MALTNAGCTGGAVVEREAVRPPPFDDCAADAYAFFGEASLTELGLDADVLPVAPPDPDRVGTIWVMATPDYAYDAGPPGGGVVMTRAFCVEYPDGGGLSGWPIADAWRLPERFAPASTTSVSWPDALPAVLIGLVLVTAVSVWAFRGRREPR
jgi:hypothetical protein